MSESSDDVLDSDVALRATRLAATTELASLLLEIASLIKESCGISPLELELSAAVRLSKELCALTELPSNTARSELELLLSADIEEFEADSRGARKLASSEDTLSVNEE